MRPKHQNIAVRVLAAAQSVLDVALEALQEQRRETTSHEDFPPDRVYRSLDAIDAFVSALYEIPGAEGDLKHRATIIEALTAHDTEYWQAREQAALRYHAPTHGSGDPLTCGLWKARYGEATIGHDASLGWPHVHDWTREVAGELSKINRACAIDPRVHESRVTKDAYLAWAVAAAKVCGEGQEHQTDGSRWLMLIFDEICLAKESTVRALGREGEKAFAYSASTECNWEFYRTLRGTAAEPLARGMDIDAVRDAAKALLLWHERWSVLPCQPSEPIPVPLVHQEPQPELPEATPDIDEPLPPQPAAEGEASVEKPKVRSTADLRELAIEMNVLLLRDLLERDDLEQIACVAHNLVEAICLIPGGCDIIRRRAEMVSHACGRGTEYWTARARALAIYTPGSYCRVNSVPVVLVKELLREFDWIKKLETEDSRLLGDQAVMSYYILWERAIQAAVLEPQGEHADACWWLWEIYTAMEDARDPYLQTERRAALDNARVQQVVADVPRDDIKKALPAIEHWAKVANRHPDATRPRSQRMDTNSREHVERIILEIVRDIGGCLKTLSRLHKAFYFAHLEYARANPGYLSPWPIVRMEAGPGIGELDSLLGGMLSKGLLHLGESQNGGYLCFELQLTESAQRLPPMAEAENAAIRLAVDAVPFAERHCNSRSWRDAKDRDELDIYLDMGSDAERAEFKAEYQRHSEIVDQVFNTQKPEG